MLKNYKEKRKIKRSDSLKIREQFRPFILKIIFRCYVYVTGCWQTPSSLMDQQSDWHLICAMKQAAIKWQPITRKKEGYTRPYAPPIFNVSTLPQSSPWLSHRCFFSLLCSHEPVKFRSTHLDVRSLKYAFSAIGVAPTGEVKNCVIPSCPRSTHVWRSNIQQIHLQGTWSVHLWLNRMWVFEVVIPQKRFWQLRAAASVDVAITRQHIAHKQLVIKLSLSVHRYFVFWWRVD